MLLTRARVLGFAFALALCGCGDDPCQQIVQSFVLESPDSDLQALIDDCAANGVCLPLCNRVVDIGGQFPGMATVLACFFEPPIANVGGGPFAFPRVRVNYQHSSCSR